MTDRYREKFSDLAFGIGTIQNCFYFKKSEAFKLCALAILEKFGYGKDKTHSPHILES